MNTGLIATLVASWVFVAASQQITVYPAYNLTFNWWYWCDANTTIIVDNSQGLWRSTNAGLNLTYLGFRSFETIQDNVDKKMLRFKKIDLSFTETRDCGASFASYADTSTRSHHYTVVNNEASGYLLATSIAAGCDLSTDFGKTWTGVYSGVGVNCQFGRKTLRDKSYDPQMIYITDDYVLKVVDKIGSPAKTVPGMSNILGIAWSYNYLFAAGNSGTYFDLWVSANAGSGAAMTWAHVQLPRRHYVHYFFLDDVSGGLWLGASEDGKTGELFTSSYDGVQFTSSIANVVVTHTYDFASVAGIEGIYIVNTINNGITQSHITFNDGGHWGLIPAPAGTGCSIYDGCSLHLHGNSQFYVGWDGEYQGYASVYSSTSAVGLILAVGNTGRSLSFNASEVNTYFSRDAGLTWTVIFKGSQIYEFGDHGGILIMADNQKPTDIINYSLDEGLTWYTYKLPAAIEIENIMVESDMGSSFVVLTKDTMFGIDYSTLHSRICGDSDYEMWSPSDGLTTQRCILGRDITYSRRMRDRKCYNSRITEHIVNATSCACTENDYECDFGFTPSSYDEKTGLFSCVWNSTDANPMTNPTVPDWCEPNMAYHVTQGYKLAAGDTCQEQGGKNLLPVAKPCPGDSASLSLSGAVVAAILIIVLFVIALIALVVSYRMKKLPEAMSSKIDMVFGGTKAGNGKKYTLLGGQEEDEEEEQHQDPL